MVSLWPWKGDDRSPASFEKTLSTLSAKITQTNTRLDAFRQRSRRLNALWTLYSSFLYLLCSVILVLVIGWRNWGLIEYAAVVGGPVLIYFVRLGLTTYYGYRTSRVQSHLDGLQKQRDDTIEKLKAATKYNTTQELLKKYGGTPTTKGKPPGGAEKSAGTNQSKQATPKGIRTPIMPPPTANIPGRNGPASLPNTPDRSTPGARRPPGQSLLTGHQQSPLFQDESAEFAPNAFSAAPQYAQSSEGTRWYDRIMDVLLGEDENQPRNRLALICNHCRLVNGQAPPGIKRLEDLGKWRCSSCGTMNGEESDAKNIVANIKKQTLSQAERPKSETRPATVTGLERASSDDVVAPDEDGNETDVTQYSEGLETDKGVLEIEEESPKPVADSEPPKRRVGRPKGSGKK